MNHKNGVPPIPPVSLTHRKKTPAVLVMQLKLTAQQLFRAAEEALRESQRLNLGLHGDDLTELQALKREVAANPRALGTVSIQCVWEG